MSSHAGPFISLQQSSDTEDKKKMEYNEKVYQLQESL
jgi:hypothetical protein